MADVAMVLVAIVPCMSCTDRLALLDVRSGNNRAWSYEELKKYVEERYR